jgi:hypothetical protein
MKDVSVVLPKCPCLVARLRGFPSTHLQRTCVQEHMYYRPQLQGFTSGSSLLQLEKTNMMTRVHTVVITALLLLVCCNAEPQPRLSAETVVFKFMPDVRSLTPAQIPLESSVAAPSH